MQAAKACVYTSGDDPIEGEALLRVIAWMRGGRSEHQWSGGPLMGLDTSD